MRAQGYGSKSELVAAVDEVWYTHAVKYANEEKHVLTFRSLRELDANGLEEIQRRVRASLLEQAVMYIETGTEWFAQDVYHGLPNTDDMQFQQGVNPKHSIHQTKHPYKQTSTN